MRATTRCLARLPARIAQDRERDQHEQRQETDALGDHAEPGRSPADRVPTPRWPEQQMTQQAVQAVAADVLEVDALAEEYSRVAAALTALRHA